MIEASPKRSIFLRMISWHYFYALKEFLIGWQNFLVFNFRYFSIGLLFKTLFSHWRRYKESYGRGFDPKRYGFVFLGNVISRVLGFTVRIAVIILGLFLEVLIFLAGAVLLFFWLALPALIVLGIYTGAVLLI